MTTLEQVRTLFTETIGLFQKHVGMEPAFSVLRGKLSSQGEDYQKAKPRFGKSSMKSVEGVPTVVPRGDVKSSFLSLVINNRLRRHPLVKYVRARVEHFTFPPLGELRSCAQQSPLA